MSPALLLAAERRRAEVMPALRLRRTVARVVDAIVQAQLGRMRDAEGAELPHCGICGLIQHKDCGSCA